MRSLAPALAALAILVGACSGGSRPTQRACRSNEARRTAGLRDGERGEELRIGDLPGKGVAIEAMAIWVQQLPSPAIRSAGDARAGRLARRRLHQPRRGPEREADPAAYAGREGFTWRFVVASPEVSRSLAATFGDQILSPPATRLVILGPDGAEMEKHIVIKGADDMAALLKEHLP